MSSEAVPPASWVTLVVEVAEADVDVVSGLLWAGGAAGIEERPTLPGRCQLRVGFRAEDAGAMIEPLAEFGTPRVEPVAAEAGLDAWREFARPWRAGRRLVVVPAWMDPPSWCGPDDLSVSIDPGHAFGSGSHATTRLCLALIERALRPGDTVADVGCGSGVLAIAALRLGAARAVGVDIEPEAVTVSAANAARAGVAERMDVLLGSVEALAGSRFDLVVANIIAVDLRPLVTELCAAVADGGALILSGLLTEQTDAVVERAAGAGFGLVERDLDEDWQALLLRRAR